MDDDKSIGELIADGFEEFAADLKTGNTSGYKFTQLRLKPFTGCTVIDTEGV